MNIKIELHGEKAVMKINGNLDEFGAEEMKKAFASFDLAKVKEVVVDLGGVEIMGSSAIGKLLLFYKHLGVNNGHLQVWNLAPHLHELFLELKLNTLFTIGRG
ncbi:MAG: STAS domain-containing protein [Proteobacteria bacterium]|nr:STAS domain-containing protein [Pseudomonadota bacterium]MBU1688587.1 STAS domain-containing protein [Pseudomonadota bacterium]